MEKKELKFDSAGNVIPEGAELMSAEFSELSKLPSAEQIGDPVNVFNMEGYIRAITFTMGKVRYAVRLTPENTTLHNIDSCFVTKRPGDRLDFGIDNYS